MHQQYALGDRSLSNRPTRGDVSTVWPWHTVINATRHVPQPKVEIETFSDGSVADL